MQIAVDAEIEKKLKEIPEPDKYVNLVLKKALTKNEKMGESLKIAAQALMKDYTTDKKLTEFTVLDGEYFHN